MDSTLSLASSSEEFYKYFESRRYRKISEAISEPNADIAGISPEERARRSIFYKLSRAIEDEHLKIDLGMQKKQRDRWGDEVIVDMSYEEAIKNPKLQNLINYCLSAIAVTYPLSGFANAGFKISQYLREAEVYRRMEAARPSPAASPPPTPPLPTTPPSAGVYGGASVFGAPPPVTGGSDLQRLAKLKAGMESAKTGISGLLYQSDQKKAKDLLAPLVADIAAVEKSKDYSQLAKLEQDLGKIERTLLMCTRSTPIGSSSR